MKTNYLFDSCNQDLVEKICNTNYNLLTLKYENLVNQMTLINRATNIGSTTKTDLYSNIINLGYYQYITLTDTVLLSYTKDSAGQFTSYTITDKSISDYTSTYIVLLPNTNILCISTAPDTNNTNDTNKTFSAKKYLLLKPTPSSAVLPIYNNLISDSISCGALFNNAVISNRDIDCEFKVLPLINNYSTYKFELWNKITTGAAHTILPLYDPNNVETYTGEYYLPLGTIDPITVNRIRFYQVKISSDEKTYTYKPIILPREFYTINTVYYDDETERSKPGDKTCVSYMLISLTDDCIDYVDTYIKQRICCILEY